MTIQLLQDITQEPPKNKALLGLDVGKTTIGLALAAPGMGIATPLQTIRRTKFTQDMQELAKIVRAHDVGGFIVGYPLNMNGSAGRQAQSVRDFAQEMLNHTDVVGAKPWIGLWDERLSTSHVHDLVDQSVHKRSTRVNAKADGLIDQLAAQVILQGALDYLKGRGRL